MPQDTPRIERLARSIGLRLREQDAEALSRWAADRVRTLALTTIDQYAELLSADSAAASRERELLTVQFSTGESYFFRDQGQFDLLAATILPELLQRRARERKLRLWSAGCAAGEEAYSLAMLVDELAPRLSGWDITILGTDINTLALEKARRGIYGDWSFRALDNARKQRYFQRRSHRWRIDRRLRSMVVFRSGDLVRDRYPDEAAGLADFDLILCRNVLIYLDARAIARILAKLGASLADGGVLLTGHSELFGHDTTPLRVRMFAQSALYQKTAPAAADAPALAEAPAFPPPRPPVRAEKPPMCTEQRATPVQSHSTPEMERERLIQAAWQHADRGMPDAAEQDCRKAIALDALDPRPYYLLAQLAQERADPAQAKTLLTKAIYLDPSFIAAYLELGALHLQAGDKKRSRRMYETARAALSKLPALEAVAPYAESNAADILAHVERLLGESAQSLPDDPATPARMQPSA